MIATARRNHLPLIGLFALLAAFFAVQGASLGVFERDYDEGVYLAQSYLVSEGYPLYEPVDSALPPFLIWSLAVLFALVGGPSILAARLAIVLSGALGLVAMGWIARRLAAPGRRTVAALAAVFLLATLPRWLLYGQIAMADVPSLSFSLLAVTLALEGWHGGRRWFFWGGVAAGVAMGFKFLAVYTAPLLALIVLFSYRQERPFTLRRFTLDGLATLGGFLLPLLAALPLLDWEAAYGTVFHFHWVSGREWVDPREALALIGTFHWEHLGWTMLALLGIAYLAWQRSWRALALLVGWQLLVVVMLSQHAPLWGHLLLPLAMPIVVAAALTVAEGVAALQRRRWALAAPSLLALLLFLALWPRALDADIASTAPVTEGELLEREVIPWLQSTVPAGEFVLTDSPMIAVRAGRLVLPDKTDTSFTKIFSGFLTAPELIAAAEQQRPAAIIFWSDRFRSLAEWESWVTANYAVGYELSPTRRIFVRSDLVARGE